MFELHSLPDDWNLNAPSGVFSLSALPDDWNLRSDGFVSAGSGIELLIQYFMVDSVGNFMVDSVGNFMVAYEYVTVQLQTLHALPDDWGLNAE